jgi:RNA polymerase sigma factor (sigma-70 family)
LSCCALYLKAEILANIATPAFFALLRPKMNSSLTEVDDIALLARIVEHDRRALQVLYDRYARAIYALAFRILGTSEEAEEIVLDVFSQVWKTAQTYNPVKARVDSWVFLITRSRALDRLRARKRVINVIESCTDAARITGGTEIQDPMDVVYSYERRELVTAALDSLPEEQRHVIQLAYYQGLSQSEIATATGQPLGTIKTRIRLGLGKLRQSLEGLL